MARWWRGAAPEELQRPRKRWSLVAFALGAVGGVVGYLLTHTLGGTFLAAYLLLAPVLGFAQWRWIGWSRSGYRRQPLRVFVVLTPFFIALAVIQIVLLDNPSSGFMALSLAVFTISMIPGLVRMSREHPAVSGWYPDPTGRFPQRGWNNVAWLDQVLRPDGVEVIDPDGAPRTTVENAPRNPRDPRPPYQPTEDTRA